MSTIRTTMNDAPDRFEAAMGSLEGNKVVAEELHSLLTGVASRSNKEKTVDPTDASTGIVDEAGNKEVWRLGSPMNFDSIV